MGQQVAELSIDEKKFVGDVHEVVSSWLSSKNPIPDSWGVKGRRIDALPSAEIEILEARGRSDVLSRARRTESLLRLLSNALTELASALQAEAEAARVNLDAVKNMCGLASLPNELLLRIFKCVVNDDETVKGPTRWKSAVKLSHVCQYFRKTALSCSQIWASVGGAGGMTATCLSRSKDVPLDVGLRIAFSEWHITFEELLPEALSHASRWKSLEMRYIDRFGSALEEERLPIDDRSIRKEFRRIDAPLLESLQIKNEGDSNEIYTDYGAFSLWNTPGLRNVKAVYYFPLSLPGLANVSQLDVTLSINQLSLVDLLTTLASMSALEDFRLKLDQYHLHFGPPDTFLGKVGLPSIHRLRIELASLDRDSLSCVKAFFSNVFFPGAVSLHVRLIGQLQKIHDGNPAHLKLSKDAMCIFCDVGQFPRVEDFHLEAYGECDEVPISFSYVDLEQDDGILQLVIPITLFPSMKHFTLQSNVRVRLLEWNLKGTYPALETITIGPAGMTGDLEEWIKDVLTKQKERGEWDAFRELIFVDGDGVPDGERKWKEAERYEAEAALALF